MAGHSNPDCVGRWVFEWNEQMGVTFVRCTRCAGSLDRLAAERENATADAMVNAEFEGRKVLHQKRELPNRIDDLLRLL